MSTILQHQEKGVLECPHCDTHFRTANTSYLYVKKKDDGTTNDSHYVYICPDCNGQVPSTPDTKA